MAAVNWVDEASEKNFLRIAGDGILLGGGEGEQERGRGVITDKAAFDDVVNSNNCCDVLLVLSESDRNLSGMPLRLPSSSCCCCCCCWYPCSCGSRPFFLLFGASACLVDNFNQFLLLLTSSREFDLVVALSLQFSTSLLVLLLLLGIREGKSTYVWDDHGCPVLICGRKLRHLLHQLSLVFLLLSNLLHVCLPAALLASIFQLQETFLDQFLFLFLFLLLLSSSNRRLLLLLPTQLHCPFNLPFSFFFRPWEHLQCHCKQLLNFAVFCISGLLVNRIRQLELHLVSRTLTGELKVAELNVQLHVTRVFHQRKFNLNNKFLRSPTQRKISTS
mmetsp:Transcript_3073/g.7462  ORF Transcript_3073/g.7462 Transcript_3073/m.7462 type:complete len:332 (+) Transcript_3073:646-1641(+)